MLLSIRRSKGRDLYDKASSSQNPIEIYDPARGGVPHFVVGCGNSEVATQQLDLGWRCGP
jgi:hypothetical protein